MIEKVKCINCGYNFGYFEIVIGEAKCPRCGQINKIRYPTKGRVHKAHR